MGGLRILLQREPQQPIGVFQAAIVNGGNRGVIAILDRLRLGLALHSLLADSQINRCAVPEPCIRPFLKRELALLPSVQVVVALGNLALQAYLRVLRDAGRIEKFSPYPFGHGAVYRIQADLPALLCCYHPSQQNTQTGRLTADMMRALLWEARRLAGLRTPRNTGT